MLLNVPIQLITSTPTLGKLGILTVSIYLQTIKKNNGRDNLLRMHHSDAVGQFAVNRGRSYNPTLP